MKKIYIILLALVFFTACKRDKGVDLRQEMRKFVIEISQYAKQRNSNFVVIPQNGVELVKMGDEGAEVLASDYLAAIDGHGQESLFYGYDKDDIATPANESDYLKSYLDCSKVLGKIILVTDYCSTSSKVSDSYSKNSNSGYVSFATNSRNLDCIPPPPVMCENADSIGKLANVKNFLYLINPETYDTKSAFISAVCATNYDALIMDLFFQDGTAFSATEIEQLRKKANGGKRLVIAYMSIGEAEDYRYYWQSSWKPNKPKWLDKENPSWKGNYKVRYWNTEWKNIIYGNENAYLDRILTANFDGVYLDIIDAFEYYER
ncbi:MAG TPA: endo alpha-1,4 polygalactosaminidase [Bacteroidales bacterium]|nr:endo alpha-1,4 polygalactosaminidase [Bacteroidales bacterium]